ncbi:MAG: Pyridoxamine 5'-phosphate oxidase [Planctomycetes bacterium ADurb.Bin412]|nr:MAG: Pyridoxamine 5'-phosphate oxidase [Planctomycetes bacterium ADurb.Bin412]
MNLKEYFEKTEGTGVLATADAEGRVDVALYARPHVIEDNTVAFIMRERLSHHNLRSNPQAAYLFIEKGPGYKGKRIYLTMLREETNTDLIKQLVRKEHGMDNPKDDANRYLVFFHVDKERPLIGDHHV